MMYMYCAVTVSVSVELRRRTITGIDAKVAYHMVETHLIVELKRWLKWRFNIQ